ncbi:hypothetical protein AVEN_76260-1 [Araneus ventricosus]|uniref:Uncharacterized protein n=1 Tax=Araneus ventricosus TaxID=182803 RepID=A0A4Y2GMI9_ARAVE|nr:hypothetical protein AVEN_76260-1 [Araneus ventricosus]
MCKSSLCGRGTTADTVPILLCPLLPEEEIDSAVAGILRRRVWGRFRRKDQEICCLRGFKFTSVEYQYLIYFLTEKDHSFDKSKDSRFYPLHSVSVVLETQITMRLTVY